MRMWSWIAAAFVILVLQTTSLGFFGGNLFFDLPLLFIYSIGLFYGARAGLLCGLAFGLKGRVDFHKRRFLRIGARILCEYVD